MKVVLTGINSFVGKELSKTLKSHQIEIVGIDLPQDIRSPDVAKLIPEGAEALIHLAAISRDADCKKDVKLAYDVNVLGTLNLIECAKKKKVSQFIFASSEWVYGEVSNDGVQTEDQPIRVDGMKSDYALTKIISEQNLRNAFDPETFAVTLLRFGIIYGPRKENWSAFEDLCSKVTKQESIEVGSKFTARRFIHVSDIADAILKSIGLVGLKTLNISGNRLINLEQIITEASDYLGKTVRIIEKSSDKISIRNPDNKYALRQLNWEPHYDLRLGVRSILDYLKKET